MARTSPTTYRQRLRRLVDVLKSAPCTDCGGTFHPECMDFDHITGEKIESVSVMVSKSYSLAKVQEEIDKCQLVCANCHRLRTYYRRIFN